MIIIKVRSTTRRYWEYLLRKKFKSKAKLEALVEYLVIKTVAIEAKKDVNRIIRKHNRKTTNIRKDKQ